ncbi:MAG: tetratricopeptide repeat protein [Chloroflexota bacterium]|nr:tetratricopeptide repeat protein [Chloroflexota bacterium]
MPFVKQTALTIRRSRSEVRDRFIGRASELRMSREHLLTPEDPAYNVLSVWGPAGVGKTTLLARLRDEARTVDCNDSCLTALVDARFFSPADLMERCAAQLRLAGAPLAAFEQVAARYKQALQPRHDEQTVARAAFLREVATLTEAKVMDESLMAGLYEPVAREANASFRSQRSISHSVGEARTLHDPLDDLTRAFVDDLNWLTTASSYRAERRVILFFDMCTPSAAETVTQLLHAMLRLPISNQVVLVVAGREPIARSLPGGQPVYSMPLASFTEDETRLYLAQHEITTADLVTMIWHLSGGLPLYVSMLAGDQGKHIDVTADIVTNMLRWTARQDDHKQRLVLHAALFSRPFTSDDLAAFHALPEPERTSHYRWLIALPFVQYSTFDGRHRYHDLAQQVMRRALFHHAPQEEQAARRALANHYRRRLERMQAAEGKRVFCVAEWLELALALVSQLLNLPDAASHASAIEQAMEIVHEAKREQELVMALHELSQDSLEGLPEEHSAPLASSSARQTAQLLLQYIEMDLARQEVLTATTGLVEVACHAPTFSAPLLARIYGKRGMAFSVRNDYAQAIADFDQALALDPLYAGAYLLRGIAFSAQSDYAQAIADFDRVLALDARATFAYAHRGIASWKRKKYQQAIADFDQASLLDQELEGALRLRRLAYWECNRPGSGDFDRAIALDSNDAQAHVLRGMACCLLDEAQQAIRSFDQALDLEPNNAWAYAGRGHVSLGMGQIEQARADLLRSQQLASNDIYGGLLLEWIDLSQEESLPGRPDLLARLEALAALDRQQPAAALCQGVALLLRERFEEALTAFEQALLQGPGMRAASFWKSLACALLGRDEEAAAALRQVRASDVPLPKVLLAPLRWLEQKNLHFYRTYAVPVLENP